MSTNRQLNTHIYLTTPLLGRGTVTKKREKRTSTGEHLRPGHPMEVKPPTTPFGFCFTPRPPSFSKTFISILMVSLCWTIYGQKNTWVKIDSGSGCLRFSGQLWYVLFAFDWHVGDSSGWTSYILSSIPLNNSFRPVLLKNFSQWSHKKGRIEGEPFFPLTGEMGSSLHSTENLFMSFYNDI